VLLEGIDVGSQMLRDGVAWYDHARDYELTESDRNLYAQCESAARAEKRGLWQDQSPLAPWEYRRLQAEQLARISGSSSSSSRKTSERTKSGLSSDFFGGLVGPVSAGGGPTVQPIVKNGSPDKWTKYESVEGHFSVIAPSNSVAGTNPLVDEKTGAPMTFRFVAGGGQMGFYFAMSG